MSSSSHSGHSAPDTTRFQEYHTAIARGILDMVDQERGPQIKYNAKATKVLRDVFSPHHYIFPVFQMKELIQKEGADPNVLNPNGNGQTLLHYLCDTCKTQNNKQEKYLLFRKVFEAFKFLLRQKNIRVDLFENTGGETVLHAAVQMKNTLFLSHLLKTSAEVRRDIDVKSLNGKRYNYTALHFAVMEMLPHESVKILLEHGANPNLSCGPQGYPIHFVMLGHNIAKEEDFIRLKIVLNYLLVLGRANPNTTEERGYTILHMIATRKRPPEDDPNHALLLQAFDARSADLCAFVLQQGVNPFKKSKLGHTALDLAMRCDNAGAAQTIKHHIEIQRRAFTMVLSKKNKNHSIWHDLPVENVRSILDQL